MITVVQKEKSKDEIIRARLHEILDMVIDTNKFEKRTRANTGTLPSVWFEFSGHVNWLEVRLSTDGYVPYAGSDRSWHIGLEEVIPETTIESMRAAFAYALSNKTESEVLQRDIEKEEINLAEKKQKVSRMKRELKKKLKKEKAAAGTATNS